MDARKAAIFVSSVWNRAAKRGYGSIQVKYPNRMTSQYFSLPASTREIRDHLTNIPAGLDIYFCPLPSTEKKRRKTSFTHSRLLWADLDEASPKCKPKPTIAWETSPGRYQALWFLNKTLTAIQTETINKSLSYALGADKGGWDLGQILRVPYTTNYKPQYDRPTVNLLWNRNRTTNFNEVARLAKKSEVKPKKSAITQPPLEISKTLTESWFNWKEIPEGKRSEKPHQWAWAFLSKGLNPDWVLTAVSQHPLTVKKYGDRATTEVQRSIDKWDEKKPRTGVREWEAPHIASATEFLSTQHEVRWMIKDIWMEDTVGMMSGPPKAFKTWLALDLGISVASGTSFMGKSSFSWGKQRNERNNVLLVQEEDPRVVLAYRLGRILESRGFDAGGYKSSEAKVKGDGITLKVAEPIPLYIVSSSGFNLKEANYIEWLEETIDDLRPRLVILDPLLVMLGDVDEFKGGEIASLLRPIKLLRDRYECSFCIVHHTYKPPQKGDTRRAGEQLYGSMAFHAWLESALHVRGVGDVDETRTVEISREFKAAPTGEKFYVYFPPEKKHYNPRLMTSKEAREAQTKKREERQEEGRQATLDDNVAQIYTLVKHQGPISGPDIQQELEWGREKRIRVVKEAITRGHIVYEHSTTGRSAKLVLSE